MTRCDYDTIFYRVFCVTLLAIAFTFTVILTNVFIDIDGILAKKENANLEKVKPPTPHVHDEGVTESYKTIQEEKEGKEDKERDPGLSMKREQEESKANFYGIKPEREADEENYRTKRSLDNPNFQFHVKNPKMKEILNNRLASLLEELDAEESHVTKDNKPEVTPKLAIENVLRKPADKVMIKTENNEEELLHLAMHNILLQGIIGHMDLNDVYKKVHNIVSNFHSNDVKDKETKGTVSNSLHHEFVEPFRRHNGKKPNAEHTEPLKNKPEAEESSQEMISYPESLLSMESKFFDELVKCDSLQKQIYSNGDLPMNTRRSGSRSMHKGFKAPKMLIKTIIDIKTQKNQNDTKMFSNNDIKGIIKLIYNGQPVKLSEDGEDVERKSVHYNEHTDNKQENDTQATTDNVFQDDSGKIVDSFLDTALSQYLKKYPKLEKKYKTKRLKRQAKGNNVIFKHKDKLKRKKNKNNDTDDEELYVEIETRFDAKGVKDGTKKKLMQSIIEKIKSAIHPYIESINKDKPGKKPKYVNVKKRIQSPLEDKVENKFFQKIILPLNTVIRRELNPIPKIIKPPLPMVENKGPFANMWSRSYRGPGFLSQSKAINSGETGQVDIDYNLVLKNNGVPQRLQQPLNTENLEIANDDNLYSNLGDLKFYVKEFDGAGFSIGFNQYVGEAPDPDSIKLFTGLHQLIKEYHKEYDNNKKNGEYKSESREGTHDMRKRDVDKTEDFHSNEYKVIFDHNYLPYDSYSRIEEDENRKVSISIEKANHLQNNGSGSEDRTRYLPLVFDENIFKKQLKPAEIFGIASLLERKKRSPIIVRRVSNLNTRSKINRYLNTAKMGKRSVSTSSTRNKRQIDKIRIIATDNIPRESRVERSDENIFVVSDENMFGNRAVLSDAESDVENDQEEAKEFIIPHHLYGHQINPFPQPHPNFNPYNIFNARSRHNSLMAKYPHIFLEEVNHSKEENNNPLFYSKLMNNYAHMINAEPTAPPFLPKALSLSQPQPEIELLESGFKPSEIEKPNFKLTVKVIPKNASDVHAGFKEIHTSINKSMNRNGLLYSSLVNVTELSKVENLNAPAGLNSLSFKSDTNNGIAEALNNFRVYPDTNDTAGTVVSDKIPSHSSIPLVKHIKEQQERMKELLNKHKIRIDAQLDHLKKEKENIESMIPTDESKQEMINVMLPLNPPQMLRLNKDEAGELISSALMKLHNAPQLNDVAMNNAQHNPNMQQPMMNNQQQHIKTTTEMTTHATHPTLEPEKLRILRTIQRNENLTNIILYKIDRNTNLLQNFLQKLVDRIEPTTTTQHPIEHKPLEKKDFTIHEPFFSKTMPNLEVHKNATHISIPFVYAYQQPYPLPMKANSPVASIVYQGHIHTNAYNNVKPVNPPITKEHFDEKSLVFDEKKLMSEKHDVNRTKFFYDDLGVMNTMPGSPSLGSGVEGKKLYDISRIKNNITQDLL